MFYERYESYLESVVEYTKTVLETFDRDEYFKRFNNPNDSLKSILDINKVIDDSLQVLKNDIKLLGFVDIRYSEVDPRYGYTILKFTVSTLKDLIEIMYRLKVNSVLDSEQRIAINDNIKHIKSNIEAVDRYISSAKRLHDYIDKLDVVDTDMLDYVDPIFAKIVQSIRITAIRLDSKDSNSDEREERYLLPNMNMFEVEYFPYSQKFKEYLFDFKSCRKYWNVVWGINKKPAFALLYPQDAAKLKNPEKFDVYVQKMDEIDSKFKKIYSTPILDIIFSNALQEVLSIDNRFYPNDIDFVFEMIKESVADTITDLPFYQSKWSDIKDEAIEYIRPFAPVSPLSIAKAIADVLVSNIRMMLMGEMSHMKDYPSPLVRVKTSFHAPRHWEDQIIWVRNFSFYEFYPDYENEIIYANMVAKQPVHIDEDLYNINAICAAIVALREAHEFVGNMRNEYDADYYISVYEHAMYICQTFGKKHALIISQYIPLLYAMYDAEMILDEDITELVEQIQDMIRLNSPDLEDIITLCDKPLPYIFEKQVAFSALGGGLCKRSLLMNEKKVHISSFPQMFPQAKHGSWPLGDKDKAACKKKIDEDIFRKALILKHSPFPAPYIRPPKNFITEYPNCRNDGYTKAIDWIRSALNPINPVGEYREGESAIVKSIGVMDGNHADPMLKEKIRREFDRSFLYNHTGTEEYYQQVDEINEILISCGFKPIEPDENY